MAAIFNPLTELLENPQLQAQASIQNLEVGVCSKCNKGMGNATIANGDTVFYCDTCRVSTPQPDVEI